MLVLLFSLAGVPPMVGFFGKFYVLKAAVDADMTWLALAGAVASVIGAFYYLRIVFYMYFGTETEGVDSRMVPVQWVVLMGAALIMVFGVVNLFGIEAAAQLWRRKRLSAERLPRAGRRCATVCWKPLTAPMPMRPVWHTDGPAWILAAEQTAGRGRRGRLWASPRGNFYAILCDAPDRTRRCGGAAVICRGAGVARGLRAPDGAAVGLCTEMAE